jgi:hypothetical protein
VLAAPDGAFEFLADTLGSGPINLLEAFRP